MENQEKKNLHFYGEKEFTWKDKQVKRRVAISAIPDGGILRIGVAVCSEKDRFTKEKGRKISEGRASKKPEDMLRLNKEKGTVPQQFISYCKTYLEGK